MTPALALRDVHKSFGATRIIQGVSLDIHHGERHAIIGPNGAGKTTLFNLSSGRLPVSSGGIALNGRPIQNHCLSVFDNLRCALLWPLGYRTAFWRLLDRERRLNQAAEERLERLALTARRDVPAGALSYAEQRALEIGLTVAGGAEVVRLDEPSAGMDRGEAGRAMALIRAITEGKTLVMVEHDMNVVFGLADRISVLVYGSLIASGRPGEVRGDPAVQQAYFGVEVA